MRTHSFFSRAAGAFVAGSLASAAVVMVLGASPASAKIKPQLSIKPGQKIVISAPSPQLQGKGDLLGDLSPKSCSTRTALLGSSEWCDNYPVKIDASDALIKSGNLQLNVLLEWAKGPVYVANCPQIGNCGSNEMGASIWQTPALQYYGGPGLFGLGSLYCGAVGATPPPLTDTATSNLCAPSTSPLTKATADATNGGLGTPDSPVSLSHVGAGICAPQLDDKNPLPANGICPIESVGVGNYNGQNPYTLTIWLVDYSGSGPTDLSADAYVPPDLSGIGSPPTLASSTQTALGTSAPLPNFAVPAFAPLGGAGGPRVDLPGIGSSAGFDGIGPAALGGDDLAHRIVSRGPKALGAAPPASGALLILWLILLPFGGLGSFVFFLWRRRRDEDEQPTTVAPAAA